jgi:hypothetical protein
MRLRQVLLACAVPFLSGCDSDRIAQLEKQNQELAAKLEAAAKSASLALQAQCSQQADKLSKEGGWDKDEMTSAINHYNSKLAKCFVQVSNTDVKTDRATGEIYFTKDLYDAFEKKPYGEYFAAGNSRTKENITTKQCYVISSAGDKTVCRSPSEFDSLAKAYLEE